MPLTCGQCAHWLRDKGTCQGQCCAPLPVWILGDDAPTFVMPAANDDMADECEVFAVAGLNSEAVPELVAALEAMVEDAEIDDSEACHCETVRPDDAPAPPRCSYCRAVAALAKVYVVCSRSEVDKLRKRAREEA